MGLMRGHAAVLALWLLAPGCSDQGSRPEARPAQPPPQVKILQFYASPGVLERGQKASLCYGVENARSLQLQPAVEPLDVSPNRCLEIAPRRTTVYTLVATGVAGGVARQTLTVQVEAAEAPAQPLIRTFAASAEETAAGSPVTLCYAARQADSVRLEPAPGALPPAATSCIAVTPQRTTTYTLTVGAGGKTDRAEVTIRVR